MDNNEYRTAIITKTYRLRKSLSSKTPFTKSIEGWQLVWSGNTLSLFLNNREIVHSSESETWVNEQINLRKRLPAFVEQWFNDFLKNTN